MSKITTIVECITPLFAQHLLSNNTRNRKISDKRVANYVTLINEGEFKFNHQGIAIDENGVLLDGQHRLTAIVKSGKSVNMLVTRGLPPEVMDTIDRSDKRTYAQTLQLDGHKNATLISSIKRFAVAYKSKNGNITSNDTIKVLDYQLKAEPNDGYDYAAELACKMGSRFPLVPRSDYAAFIYLALNHVGCNEEKVFDFLEKISKGTNLESDDPCFAFRQFYTQGKNIKVSRLEYRIVILIQAWNYYITGARSARLKYVYNSDVYPRIKKE